jgi:cation diffusion facilitator CzcD-associated flavoprotein CzcO
MAIGISYFSFIPENFSGVPRDLLSHASHHTDLGKFRGKKVVVLGGGSSAMDMAGLLRDQGVDVTMVCRRPKLKFPPKPSGRPRSFWQKLRHPPSGLGDGLRRRFLANCPIGFHYFPEQIRLYTVQRSLGPAGGWFSKDMVVGRVPVLTGSKIESIDSKQGLAQLRVRQTDGTVHELVVDHVIAATGYRVAIARLDLLSNDIRKKLKSVNDTPILSSRFESSVPGLYFVGVSAANSFGPVMRFACGAQFTAERVSRGVANSVRRKSQ